MKLIFSTLICPEYTPEELKGLCDKWGLSGVEIRTGGDNKFDTLPELAVTDIASSLCLFGYNEEQLSGAKKLLLRMESDNVGAVRVFLGNFKRRYSDNEREIDYAGIVRMLQAMCDFAKGEIWVETHNEFATGKVLRKLMEDVSRPNCKIIWDVMHPFEDGELPRETFEYIKDYVAHVHIKDGRKRRDPEWHDFEYTPLGEGEVPIKEIINLMRAYGYKGGYSLEWENMWRDELKELNWSVDDILEKFVSYMGEIERSASDEQSNA